SWRAWFLFRGFWVATVLSSHAPGRGAGACTNLLERRAGALPCPHPLPRRQPLGGIAQNRIISRPASRVFLKAFPPSGSGFRGLGRSWSTGRLSVPLTAKRNEPVRRKAKARFLVGFAKVWLVVSTTPADQQPDRGNPSLRPARADLPKREVDRP